MRSRIVAGLVLVASLMAVPGAVTAQPWLEDPVGIVTLSNRADLISGGDALVEVVLPDRADPAQVTVTIDGRDVTEAFAVRDDGRFYGRVDGLAVETSRVTATLADGSGAYLDVTNHAIEGPVFAGPQVQPWLCQTEQSGLGPAYNASCHVREPVFTYFYKPPGSTRVGSFDPREFEPYDPDDPPPAEDIAVTTTDTGETVPYIVRRERGTIDRAIYDVLVLWDPEAAPWEPWQPHRGWNGKLLYHFGGGLEPNHEQGATHDILDPTSEPNTLGAGEFALSRGFAVATSTLNMLGLNINDVVSAESAMMVKEHFAEAYGVPRYTLGQGCSGGSMQQHLIAANYPGLLDGIQPACSFPDSWTAVNEVVDCDLLQRYFTETSPHLWAVEHQQAEVMDKSSVVTCAAWAGVGNPGYAETVADPTFRCVVGGDPEWVYRAEDNPEGVRCTFQDYQQAVFGSRAPDAWGPVEERIGRGFAPRPLDNVGVQYGLEALESGTITPEQFVDLNEQVGGFDIDYGYTPERAAADPDALEIVYRSGRVTNGALLATVPIIDFRGHANDAFHDNYRTASTKERLRAANGHADNHVAFIDAGPLVPHPQMKAASLLALDAWVAAIEEDDRDVPAAQKVVDNKPEGLTDTCWLPGDATTSSDPTVCGALYPSYGNARTAAGGPLADDVMKCQLKPLDRADYDTSFTDAQWARLEAAFPDGVCDWSQPGVAQQDPVGTWLTFADGPRGRPLGDAPASVPFGSDGPGALVTRHGGATRIETAVAVSGLGVESAERVVLARADEYADALAGGPLAVQLGAPLLLSAPDVLSGSVAEEIRRLGAAGAVLLGGEAALSAQVAADLEELGMSVRRVAGANRFATAEAIAGELPDATDVLVARGDGFADALAASGLGSATGRPVLLVEPGRLPTETAAALAGAASATIVGGAAAVSEAVGDDIDAVAGEVTRVAGATRYATSAAVADAAMEAGTIPAVTWVATGADFPDALVAGAATGRDRGVLLLVDGVDLDGSPETRGWLTVHRDAIDVVRIAGGAAAVAFEVEQALRGLL